MLLHFPFRIMNHNLGSSWQSQHAINTSTNNTTTRSRSAVGNPLSRVINSSDRCGTTAHCQFPSASVVWSLRWDRRRHRPGKVETFVKCCIKANFLRVLLVRSRIAMRHSPSSCSMLIKNKYCKGHFDTRMKSCNACRAFAVHSYRVASSLLKWGSNDMAVRFGNLILHRKLPSQTWSSFSAVLTMRSSKMRKLLLLFHGQ